MTTVGPAPSPANITSVFITSATATYGTVAGSAGYEFDASSTNFTTGVVLSSITTDNTRTTLLVLGLNPDTTYFFKIGSLFNGSTSYATATPASTSTYTNSILNSQVFKVFYSSVTVNWTPFAAGSGTNTAQGYTVLASTASDFSGTVFS